MTTGTWHLASVRPALSDSGDRRVQPLPFGATRWPTSRVTASVEERATRPRALPTYRPPRIPEKSVTAGQWTHRSLLDRLVPFGVPGPDLFQGLAPPPVRPGAQDPRGVGQLPVDAVDGIVEEDGVVAGRVRWVMLGLVRHRNGPPYQELGVEVVDFASVPRPQRDVVDARGLVLMPQLPPAAMTWSSLLCTDRPPSQASQAVGVTDRSEDG